MSGRDCHSPRLGVTSTRLNADGCGGEVMADGGEVVAGAAAASGRWLPVVWSPPYAAALVVAVAGVKWLYQSAGPRVGAWSIWDTG